MTLLTKVRKVASPLAGAVFIDPLLNLFAPSLKPLITQLVQSDEARQFLEGLVEATAETGSGVCTEFLAHRAERVLGAIRKTPKLDEALIVALRRTFSDIRDELRRENQHRILNSSDQFFADWDEQFEKIQKDDVQRRELLETKQFARLFYELPETEVGDLTWWMPVRTQLEAWTSYASIPPELEDSLKKNLLFFAGDSLTSTLDREEYKESWNEFQKSVGTQTLTILRELQTYILELKELVNVAGGQFIKDGRLIEFPLRKPVDALLEDLSAKEIYIQRETFLIEEERVQVSGLRDLAARDGYFLLAAPAGSGKSTLMARWIREFVSSLQVSDPQAATKVCYHFYSKQEGTSDHNKGLTILSDQLLKAHYIQANVNSFNPATIDAMIPNLLELDHPTRLLVIVDGLDEAGEPSTAREFLSLFKRIFPHKPGKNTTIILTVRDDEGANSLQHYRQEFGLPLNVFEIGEVSVNSLASYLSNAADTRLKAEAQDENFLAEIIAKTEGLAIYVHYLIDELSQVEAARWPEIVASLPRGFEKYVSASLPKALRGEAQWEDALSFIALTQSPLDEQDLMALTELSGNKLKKVDFDRVSWNIKRWLRNEDDIWAFSHQKIGEVFYELYVADERAAYLTHLLAYCTRWAQHQSHYVLQNYAELLRREKRAHELYDLAADEDFLDLQRNKLTDNPNAPLQTLQAAILHATEEDAAVMMAKFSLAHAAIVEEMSVESWLEAYNKRGFLVVLSLADNFSDHNRRVAWYLLTASKLATSNKEKDAENVLKKLDASTFPSLSPQLYNVAESTLPILLQVTEVELVRNIYAKALAESKFDSEFSSAAKYFITLGDFNKAEEIARSIRDTALRAQALCNVGVALADPQHSDRGKVLSAEATELARSIKDAALRAQTLCNLAAVIADAQRFDEAKELLDEAEEITRSIEDLNVLSKVITDLIVSFAHARVFERAEQIVHSFQFGETRLKYIVMALANAQHFDEAEQLAHGIVDPHLRSKAIRYIAKESFKTQHLDKTKMLFEEAEQIAYSMEDPASSSLALGVLAADLARVQQFDKAEELVNKAEQIARSVSDPKFLARALKVCAVALFQAQRFDRAKDLFEESQQTAFTIEDSALRSQSLRNLAMALASVQLFDEANQVALLIEDARERSLALRNLARSTSAQDLDKVSHPLDRVEQSVDFTESSNLRAQTLTALAGALANAGYLAESGKLFDEAEETAGSIEQPELRAQTFYQLATALAQARFFDKAEPVARTIKDSELRTKAIRSIAKVLTGAQLYDKAEQVARTIKDPEWRAKALFSLAATLADAQEFVKAKELYGEVMQLALSIKGYHSRSRTVGYVGRILTLAQILHEVEQIDANKDLEKRGQILCNLATALADIQQFDKVREVLDKAQQDAPSIKKPSLRARTLRQVATTLIHARLFEEAEQIANSIEQPNLRAQTLGNLAEALAGTPHLDKAKELFHEAEEIARSINHFTLRSQTLRNIVKSLGKAGLFDEATRILKQLQGADLIAALEEFAKAKRADGLKQNLISLSYNADFSLQACAQMILFYESHAEAIYKEVLKYK